MPSFSNVFVCFYVSYVFLRVLCVLRVQCVPQSYVFICSTSLRLSTASMSSICFYLFCVSYVSYICSDSYFRNNFYCFMQPTCFYVSMCPTCSMCTPNQVCSMCLAFLNSFPLLLCSRCVSACAVCPMCSMCVPDRVCSICSTSLMLSIASKYPM